jgi:hypothetical protein
MIEKLERGLEIMKEAAEGKQNPIAYRIRAALEYERLYVKVARIRAIYVIIIGLMDKATELEVNAAKEFDIDTHNI